MRECPTHGGTCRDCAGECRAGRAPAVSNVHPLVRYIDAARLEADISKRELSLRAGYNGNYWINATRGHHAPSLAAFCDHAQALGFNLRLMRDA